MTFTKCKKDTNCKNSCLLVLDAMFFFYLIQALINKIEYNYESKSRDKKFAIFKSRLSNVLNALSFCSLNKKFNISEKVYKYEISPTNRLSTLRKTINSFNTMCNRLNRNFKQIERVIKNYCEITSINDNEVNEFRNLFGRKNKPKDRDATLLLLGLKKINNCNDTLLLTSDINLSNSFKYLDNKHNIPLTFGTFSTDQYYIMRYLTFITIAHDCCQLNKQDYITLFNIKLIAEELRKNTLNIYTARIIQKKLEGASIRYSSSIESKQVNLIERLKRMIILWTQNKLKRMIIWKKLTLK